MQSRNGYKGPDATPTEGHGVPARAAGKRQLPPKALPCVVAEPVLSQGPERELRQARADAIARAHEPRGCDTLAVAGQLLGREPAAGTAAGRTVPAGRGHQCPPDLRGARLRARG